MMPAKTWTLTDVDAGIFEADWKTELTDDVIIEKRTLQGGRQHGVDSVKVTSDTFSFEVLPTRGMNIWKMWAGNFEYGWKSPTKGPVHPSLVPLMEPSGLGWLDGFDEVFARCGLESNGAPEFDAEGKLVHPLHGKIANTPARKVSVEVDADCVKIIGVTEEARFHFMKLRLTSTITWKMGTTSLEIDDEVENLSAQDADIQMLYHINFGVPLLDGGSQVVAPIKTVVPRNDHSASSIEEWQNYSAPTIGFEEQVYFLELAGDDRGNSQTVLKNADESKGVAIRFNVNELPCFSLWKNTAGAEDGYVTGLEPATNFPNPKSFEKQKGRVVHIPGRGKHSFSVGIDCLDSPAKVSKAVADVKKLEPADATLNEHPLKHWCDGA